MHIKLKDTVSGLSHLLGAFLAVAGLVVLIVLAVRDATVWHIVSFTIFGVSMILLYSASAIYHLLPSGQKVTLILRKIDHMMIFILIAGTYTPICLVALRGSWGWSLFGLIWGLTVAGIMLKAFYFRAPRWLSTVIYIAMGWLVVVASVPLAKSLPSGGLFYLALGGMFYSVGALIYGTKWPPIPSKWFSFHEVFHIFVLLGSLSHFYLMLEYMMKIRL